MQINIFRTVTALLPSGWDALHLPSKSFLYEMSFINGLVKTLKPQTDEVNIDHLVVVCCNNLGAWHLYECTLKWNSYLKVVVVQAHCFMSLPRILASSTSNTSHHTTKLEHDKELKAAIELSRSCRSWAFKDCCNKCDIPTIHRSCLLNNAVCHTPQDIIWSHISIHKQVGDVLTVYRGGFNIVAH